MSSPSSRLSSGWVRSAERGLVFAPGGSTSCSAGGSCALGLAVAVAVIAMLASVAPAAAQCACSDGFVDAFGCCGGDGQRLCSLTPIISDCPSACLPPAVNVGTNCAIPRKTGEYCSAFYPCDDNNTCWPMPWEGFGVQKCVPDQEDNGNAWGNALCSSLYDSDLHAGVRNSGLGAVTFGVAGNAAVGVAGYAEVGVVYGGDGRYGCYRTLCAGVVGNVAIGAAGCAGEFASYAALAGDSWAVGGSAGIILGYSDVTSFGWDSGPRLDQLLGATQCVTLEASLLPVDLGEYYCNTAVNTIIDLPPLDVIYMDPEYTGTETGSSSQPFNTLAEAIAAVVENGTIRVRGGYTPETLSITKKVFIVSDNDGVFVAGQNPP